MAELSVSMFGKLEISRDGVLLDSGPPRKARALLVYLLIHRRAHPREKLATILWHGATKQTKAYLRKALWQLRKSVQTEGDCSSPLIVTDRDWVQIPPGADVWVDVDVFENAFNDVRDCPVSDMTAAHVKALRRAVDLYTGDFLENWYHDWCLQERERLLDVYLRMLDRLASSCEARAMYDVGIDYGLESLRIAPARERTHRQLMRLRAMNGNRTAALRQYERCAEVLEQELGVSPATATQRLHEKILRDTFPSSVAPPNFTSAPGPPRRQHASTPAMQGVSENLGPGDQAPNVESLEDGLDRIRELQSTLAAVQRRIRHDIEAVEVALQQQK